MKKSLNVPTNTPVNNVKENPVNNVKENIRPNTPTSNQTKPNYCQRSTKDEMEIESINETHKGLVELGKLQERSENRNKNKTTFSFTEKTSKTLTNDEFNEYINKADDKIFTKDHIFLIVQTQSLINEKNYNETKIEEISSQFEKCEKELIKEKEYSSDLKSELSSNTKEIDCIEKENELEVYKLKGEKEKTDRLHKDLNKRTTIYEKVLSFTLPMSFITLAIIVNFILKFVK